MGTVVTAKVWGASGENTAQAVLDRIAEMDESNLSAHNDTSDIARINSASGQSVKVDNYTANLITRLLLAADQTNGAFDPTIGALVRLWDIGGPNEQVPTAEEISAARATVDWHQVQVSGDTVQIGKGQSLDIGAAGKGAACDAAKEILTENQAKSAVISVGGSILLYGEIRQAATGLSASAIRVEHPTPSLVPSHSRPTSASPPQGITSATLNKTAFATAISWTRAPAHQRTAD